MLVINRVCLKYLFSLNQTAERSFTAFFIPIRFFHVFKILSSKTSDCQQRRLTVKIFNREQCTSRYLQSMFNRNK